MGLVLMLPLWLSGDWTAAPSPSEAHTGRQRFWRSGSSSKLVDFTWTAAPGEKVEGGADSRVCVPAEGGWQVGVTASEFEDLELGVRVKQVERFASNGHHDHNHQVRRKNYHWCLPACLSASVDLSIQNEKKRKRNRAKKFDLRCTTTVDELANRVQLIRGVWERDTFDLASWRGHGWGEVVQRREREKRRWENKDTVICTAGAAQMIRGRKDWRKKRKKEDRVALTPTNWQERMRGSVCVVVCKCVWVESRGQREKCKPVQRTANGGQSEWSTK